jgi:microsomal dipeptidase-like Zn-dependent dipeptidase
MIARTGEKYGMDRIGLGSDLCQDHPDSVVEWMRSGRWSKEIDYGEGTKDNAGFPSMPSWFKDNRDFGQIREGLRSTGMSTNEINGVMGDNWHRFFTENFGEK